MVTRQTFIRGAQKGVKTLISFIKYIVPTIVVIKLLEHSGYMGDVAQFCAPAMKFLGLPGEAALAMLIAQFSLYGGLAAVASLGLSIKEATIILGFIACFHAIILESIVIQKAKANMYLVLALRLCAALLTALLLGAIM